MIQYGLISKTDATTIEKTLDLIMQSHKEDLYITEIGIFDGQTARGIREYILSKNRGFCYTAIDNNKDKEVLRPFESCNLIIGNSNEVYHRLEDNSQDFIFVDGCHCFAHVISDFFCYAPKVKVGGFLAFHDTGRHIKEFKDFQHGDKNNPDAYISVRKALGVVGLLEKIAVYDVYSDSEVGGKLYQWPLIFDESDETDEAGGICAFKKLY
jgi:hypothetical protein